MRLRRDLNMLHATMMGLGSTICAGLFVIIGRAVEIAGPAVILSFFLCGIINFATMFSYCELGAAIPRVGGEYAYVKRAFRGGVLAFLTGWYEWISNIFYAALMVLGAAHILFQFTPVNKTLVIAVLVIVFTLINMKGIKETGFTQTLLTSMLVGVIILYIVTGLNYGIGPRAFQPFMPRGLPSIIVAIAFLFETYLGIEAIAATQAEIKEPEKTIPRAMILCSLILIVLYCSVAYVTVGILSSSVLTTSQIPLNLVAAKTMGKTGVMLVTIAGLAAASTSLNSAIIASSRVAYAMSLDGYFPKALRYIHDRHRTPCTSILVGSMIILLLSILNNLEFVVYSITVGFLVGFSMVNLSLIKLRRSEPCLKRPFKTPLYPLMPIVGIVTSSILLMFIDLKPLVFGLVWGLFGLIVCLLGQKGKHHPTHQAQIAFDLR